MERVSDPWEAHEESLVASAHRAHEQYDKTVVYLSAGALAISFAFLRDIVGGGSGRGWWWLIGAWATWGLSVTATLLSFYMSIHAHWQEVDDCRRIRAGGAPRAAQPGGATNRWIPALNASAGVLFFLGVLLIAVFATVNVGGKP